jgi:hypothetical protein
MKKVLYTLAVWAAVTAVPSHAAVIGFVDNASTNSVDWTNAVLGLGGSINANVDFEGQAVGTMDPNFYLGTDGVTFNGSTFVDQILSGTGPNDGNTTNSDPGEGPHPGSNFLVMPTPGGGSNFLIVSFAAPVLGAGIFTIDRFFGLGFTNDIAIEAYDGPDATGALLASFSGLNLNFQPDNLYFMGVASTAGDIRSIRIVRSNDDTGDTIGLDNLVFATPAAVPEPASIGLFGAGLAALGWLRRARRA